jgi:hypothetical protein
MNQNKIQQQCTNFERLFRFYLIWFRLAGVPLKSYKESKLYDFYSAVILLNAYSVVITMSADAILHFDDLERIMENSRVIVPASSSLWVHLCLRYTLQRGFPTTSNADITTQGNVVTTRQDKTRLSVLTDGCVHTERAVI